MFTWPYCTGKVTADALYVLTNILASFKGRRSQSRITL